MSKYNIKEIASLLPQDQYEIGGKSYDPFEFICQVAIALQTALNGDSAYLDKLETIENTLAKQNPKKDKSILAIIRNLINDDSLIIAQNENGYEVTEKNNVTAGGDSLLKQTVNNSKIEKAVKKVIKHSRKKTTVLRKATNSRKEKLEILGKINISTIEVVESHSSPDKIKHLHISNHNVVAISNLTKIVEKFPNLSLITLPKSYFNMHFLKNTKYKRYLDSQNIEVKIGYWRDF